MCGIAGRFDPIALPPDPDWHPCADRLLAHRGPDGGGYFRDSHCELVHRRLKIIDLTPTGDQPMPNEDGEVRVIFNGEIYNYLDLRAGLQERGHRFRGTSDTEVLVHLYEEEGAALVHRLRGMFAFAIYDARERRLLLARDRFGIKPLYYGTVGRCVIFASEIKAILAAASFDARIDRQACYDFLGLGYIPEPSSGFVGLRMLPKGTSLLFDARGEHAQSCDLPVPDPSAAMTMEEAVDGVRTALLSAAAAQSRADVPVAALLSGGIDSSLVVAAVCRATGGTPETFNVRFPDAAYDETPMALAVSRQYGTRHHTIDLDDTILSPDSVLGLLRHFDQPFADSSLLPTFAVSSAIRSSGLVCTVSGDGGDEAFGGYASFWRLHSMRSLMRMPARLRSFLERAGRALVPVTSDWGRQLARGAALAGAGRGSTAEMFAGFYNYMSEVQKAELVRPEARHGLSTVSRVFGHDDPPAVDDLETLSLRLTRAIFEDNLPSEMLRKVDMMSMRASIEVRVPLLDERVVACGLRLPHALKTDGRRGKLVLRRLAQEWLPARVAAHRKQGFAIPLDRMVDRAFHAMLSDLLLSEASHVGRIVNIELVKRWVRWFREAGRGRRVGGVSRGGLYQRIFILLALEVWLREQRLTW